MLDGECGGTVDLIRGATTAEIAAAKGWGDKRTRKHIRAKLAAGLLEPVVVYRERLGDGVQVPIWGWRVVKS